MFPYSTGTVQYWKISAIHGHRRRSASRMFQGSGASMDWSWCFGHAASSGRWQRAHNPAVVWSIAARQILRGGAEFILPSSAAFKLQIWLDAIGCTPVAKWTLLGTGGMNACASARAARCSVQSCQWAGTLHWRHGLAHGASCFPHVSLRFAHAPRDHSYPQDRTDAVRSVRCSIGAHGLT